MRKQWIGAWLLLAGALAGPLAKCAMAQNQGDWGYSGYPSINTPLPLGPSNASTGGIYGAAEFIFMSQNRPLGDQVVAIRGFRDTDGTIVGIPGQFVGSGNQALSTTDLGRTSWAPGYRATLGYKLEDGSSISISYLQLVEVKYAQGAGPIAPDQNPGALDSNTFLYAPVFGFSPQFSGPTGKVAVGSGTSPYGIWNGATTMQEQFIERYTQWDITARMPVFESEYAKSYALGGGRFAWFWDEYKWDVVDTSVNGNTGPQDAANYHNIMSQRMYGPFIGLGNDIWLGNNFALSTEVSAAALLNVIKTRAAYVLGDNSTESKHAFEYYSIVPNLNANASIWWYPIEGMQVRFGYNLMTFFDTQYMQQPVGYNAASPDPSYKTLPFRMLQGFNIGVGYSF